MEHTGGHFKKMPFVLFLMLLILAIVLDIIGVVPGLGFIITFLFLTMTKALFFMFGYHGNWASMIMVYVGTLLTEFAFSPLPANVLYIVFFYALNNIGYYLETLPDDTQDQQEGARA